MDKINKKILLTSLLMVVIIIIELVLYFVILSRVEDIEDKELSFTDSVEHGINLSVTESEEISLQSSVALITYNVTATVTPSDVTDYELNWSVSIGSSFLDIESTGQNTAKLYLYDYFDNSATLTCSLKTDSSIYGTKSVSCYKRPEGMYFDKFTVTVPAVSATVMEMPLDLGNLVNMQINPMTSEAIEQFALTATLKDLVIYSVGSVAMGYNFKMTISLSEEKYFDYLDMVIQIFGLDSDLVDEYANAGTYSYDILSTRCVLNSASSSVALQATNEEFSYYEFLGLGKVYDAGLIDSSNWEAFIYTLYSRSDIVFDINFTFTPLISKPYLEVITIPMYVNFVEM